MHLIIGFEKQYIFKNLIYLFRIYVSKYTGTLIEKKMNATFNYISILVLSAASDYIQRNYSFIIPISATKINFANWNNETIGKEGSPRPL